MTLVREAMVPDPKVLPSSASAQEAGELLARPEVRAVLVVDGDRLVGVVTCEVLVELVVAAGRDPRTTPVGDVAAAVTWYGEVLGLPHLYTFGDLAFFDCGGVRLFLSQEHGSGGQESVLYFQVPDINAAYDTLTARGVSFQGAPHMIVRHESGVEEWMAFFPDPDGHLLAIMSQVRP